MTIADTVFDVINDNWGSGGYAGATPKIETTETQRSNNVVSTDVIQVRHYTLRDEPQGVNDKYEDHFYSIDVSVSSKTSPAQLELLVNEVDYLLKNTTMTGIQIDAKRRIIKDYSEMRWQQAVHSVVLRVHLVALLSDSAVTSAAGVTASMQALLMYGSANAAWIPCVYNGYSGSMLVSSSAGVFAPPAAGTKYLGFIIPLPTLKGTLKLYVGDLKIDGITGLDANNYITQITLNGFKMSTSANTPVFNDATNKTANETITWAHTADDMSSYDYVHVFITTEGAGNTLRISNLLAKCYYAT